MASLDWRRYEPNERKEDRVAAGRQMPALLRAAERNKGRLGLSLQQKPRGAGNLVSMGHDFLAVFYRHDSDPTNFQAQLFRLIAKADPGNLFRLSLGFPREVLLYQWWMETPAPAPEIVLAKAEELMLGVPR